MEEINPSSNILEKYYIVWTNVKLPQIRSKIITLHIFRIKKNDSIMKGPHP